MSNLNDTNGGDNDGRRVSSISVKQLKDEISNAIELALVKLQLKLIETYAVKADVDRLQGIARGVADDATKAIKELVIDQKDLKEQIEALEKDKAGRDAVTSFKKWLTGGAILATVFMGIQLVLSFYLITHGTKKP